MAKDISRRQLIATGAAGTAGALGLGACNTSTAFQDEPKAQAAGAEPQDADAQDAANTTPIWKKIKPFLAESYVKETEDNKPSEPTGPVEKHKLYAWMVEQMMSFDPNGNYTAPMGVPKGVMDVFDLYEDRLENMIDVANLLQKTTDVTLDDGTKSDIIILPPMPPQPGPNPGREGEEAGGSGG